jgi:hypothetical protein
LKRPVVLIVLKIASANEDEDVTRGVIQTDYRTLKIFRRRLAGSGG